MDFSQGRLVSNKEHSIENVSVKNAPRLFSKGSFLLQAPTLQGSKTAANWNEIVFRDSMELESGYSLKVSVQKCDAAQLPLGEKCADNAELESWFKQNKFSIVTSQNFVNYEDVNLEGNHVDSFVEPLESFTILPEDDRMLRFRLTEKRISLQDSLWQILTPDEELQLLNVERQIPFEIPVRREPEDRASFFFDLGQQIKIEKRVVNSLPSVFGEIGGFGFLLRQFVVLLIGGYQAKALFADQMRSLFRVNMQNQNANKDKSFSNVGPFSYTKRFPTFRFTTMF